MKISVLASGSKGNCTYIETEHNKILIDMGTTTKYIENSLIELGIDPSSIDTIFITHDHKDHTSALSVFVKRYNPTVYMTEKLNNVLKEKTIMKNYQPLEENLQINDLLIKTIKTSHDASDSVGFVFESKDSSLVYITDTGYINVKYFEKLKNKKIYIFESNHDVEMLMNGKYRHELKVRILGDRGHLSNEMSSNYLSTLIGDKTECIILAHLSDENNTKELAFNTLEKKLKETNIENKRILIAEQLKRTDLIEI